MSIDPTTAPEVPAYLQDSAGLFYRVGGGTPGAPGVTDHGALTGLTGTDHHPQYHNDARGDARYVNVTGDTMTGALTVGLAGAADATGVFTVSTDAGAGFKVARDQNAYFNKAITFQTIGTNIAFGTSGSHGVVTSENIDSPPSGYTSNGTRLFYSVSPGQALVLGDRSGAATSGYVSLVHQDIRLHVRRYLDLGNDNATAFIRSNSIFGRTTTGTSNLVIATSPQGVFYRSTSSLRYKTTVTDAPDSETVIRALHPVTYLDLGQVERHSDYLTKGSPTDYEGGVPLEPTPYLGLIAEDVAAIADPLAQTLVEYDAENRPDSVNYDRVGVALVDVVQKLLDRVDVLETQVTDLTARLVSLETP